MSIIDLFYIPAKFLANVDIEFLEAAFAEMPPLDFGQPWRAEPEPAFRPAVVRAGWQGGELLVFARLDDDDIHNTARGLNEHTWMLGDVLEIFLRNTTQKEYLELHVTPGNQKLQLCIPSLEELIDRERRHSVMEAFQIRNEIFSTHVWVKNKERRWWVLASIPFGELALPEKPVGAEILFSFSRYDYTRGAESPVLSTTSHHQEINFHRQHEWHRFVVRAA